MPFDLPGGGKRAEFDLKARMLIDIVGDGESYLIVKTVSYRPLLIRFYLLHKRSCVIASLLFSLEKF